jgi:hypothetical protein
MKKVIAMSKTIKGHCILLAWLTGLFALMVLPSCEKEKEDLSKGFSKELQSLVPDSTIQLLRDMGMIIHEGKNPPIIEGKFYLAPNLMDSSNVPNETREKGHRFADYRLYFHHQNNKDLTIKLNSEALHILSDDTLVIGSSVGEGGFLSGNGKEFSVFIISEGETYHNDKQDTARYRSLGLYSGELTPEGIKNYQKAFLMLDDYGDEFDLYIPVNTGRIFHDGDFLARRLTNSEWKIKNSVIFSSDSPVLPSMMEEGR